ncbi:hypothetical protein L3V77_20380 [Vibrio sp. DW001]|uniref:hypothetical protein n=1 Tax=Vibrio sp. DW001 TaxID=2912315 RepID=UPI0023B1D35D|nr:hypothetical protein [Vibrio sp. DW001]WED29769.1 hypothetical protein L3V77_20380 [Vibrio sp. DW001]
MIVSFTMLKGEISWDAPIHQLNSDILLRHIRLNGNVDSIDIELSYCEQTCEGDITNSNNQLIGNFSISF